MIRAGACVLPALAALAAGCAGTPQASTPRPSMYAEEVSRRQADIGTKRYFNQFSLGQICDDVEMKDKCRTPKPGTEVAVLSVQAPPSSTMLTAPIYMVKLAGGATAYMDGYTFTVLDTENARKKALADKAECDRRGGVSVGMTADQVRASCWGKPRSVNTTTTSGGNREQWVYPGYNYVYLIDGVVSSIQTSR